MDSKDHRGDYRFVERLRVRWAEIDSQHIVFNGHYLTYFDTAVAGYWRALALPYAETMALLGGDLFVRKATVEYEKPAHYDDVLGVGIRCARIGNSSITFECAVFRDAERLVTGQLIYVFADPVARTAKPVPAPLRETFESYEAGAPMVDVKVGSWRELADDAKRIREEVFVSEQRIPAELEWDAADATARHAVAFNRIGAALATGRLVEHAAGVGKIGRMAVRRAARGSGIGRAVLEALLVAARERGDRQALLHAQVGATSFYTEAGFQSRGAEFDEAGIRHVEMVRSL